MTPAGGEVGAAGEGHVAAGGGPQAEELLGRQAREDLLHHQRVAQNIHHGSMS